MKKPLIYQQIKKFHSVLVLLVMIGMCGAVRAAPINYVLTTLVALGAPSFGIPASTLTGFITIDDSGIIGEVTNSEITDWSFKSVGWINFDIHCSITSSQSCTGPHGCFSINDSSLIFDFFHSLPLPYSLTGLPRSPRQG